MNKIRLQRTTTLVAVCWIFPALFMFEEPTFLWFSLFLPAQPTTGHTGNWSLIFIFLSCRHNWSSQHVLAPLVTEHYRSLVCPPHIVIVIVIVFGVGGLGLLYPAKHLNIFEMDWHKISGQNIHLSMKSSSSSDPAFSLFTNAPQGFHLSDPFFSVCLSLVRSLVLFSAFS